MDLNILDKVVYNDQGLVPCIVQDIENGDVLMMAWMNKRSLLMTIEKNLGVYWSRSRQELWIKGETSGHYQHVKEMYLDCDYDTILIKVVQDGAACHTGNRSCFFNKVEVKE